MADVTLESAVRLALQAYSGGQIDQAAAICNQILRAVPKNADALHLLGVIAGQKGDCETAVALIRRAIAQAPSRADFYDHLGTFLRSCGNLSQALEAYTTAGRLNPGYADAHSNMGGVLQELGHPDEALTAYETAIAVDPGHLYSRLCLANLCYRRDDFDRSIAELEKLLAIDPQNVEALSQLSGALKHVGRVDDSIEISRRLIPCAGAKAVTYHDDLILGMLYSANVSWQTVLTESRLWDALYAKPLCRFIQPHVNDPDPDRRVRVGYVSRDFAVHSVGFFTLPLIQSHDRGKFEVYCYSNLSAPDEWTEKFRRSADHWREIFNLTDFQAAEMIRQDRIDILVDLGGHTVGNRLLVFAQKPAPIQVNWQGYAATTGMSVIDYRLTDAYADPVGKSESACVETLVRLPVTNWCYAPGDRTPDVSTAPSLAVGYVTFGSFNNNSKVTECTLRLWARVLAAVPNSRLFLKSRGASCASFRERVVSIMSAAGVSGERLLCTGQVPLDEHLQKYGQVDIALDTFPYHGTTTTCEALWMGVPAVTLAGDTHVSRVGVSLLTNVGLGDLIADNADRYVEIAAALAADEARRIDLRGTMRARMRKSPLTDAGRFARDVESAYRKMWETWCDRK